PIGIQGGRSSQDGTAPGEGEAEGDPHLLVADQGDLVALQGGLELGQGDHPQEDLRRQVGGGDRQERLVLAVVLLDLLEAGHRQR
ncbi:hypothetical protein DF186_19635, partial [Enterococcus hirae]